jgi:hypothetical protein
MTPVEWAAVYLVLSFPGVPHAVAVLPMRTADICWREAKEIEGHYGALSMGTKLFAHCVENIEETRPR